MTSQEHKMSDQHNVESTIEETRAEANEAGNDKIEEWKPSKSEWLIMVTMSVTALLVALDASIIVCVLPVSHMSLPFINISSAEISITDFVSGTER